MSGGHDTATTRDAGTGPPMAVSSGSAPPGGRHADPPRAQAHEDEQTVQEATVREQLARAGAERDEYLETLQRVQAEYDNYRRRAKREQGEQYDRGGQALAESLLPVLDSFDAARAHAPEVLAPLRSMLEDALRAAGLERFEPTGKPFDPAEQHAVEQLPAQDEPAAAEDDPEQAAGPAPVVVHEVLRPGYRWRGRLVRPAMVRVGPD